MNFFTETMHLPWIIGFMVIIIEFFGAISLLLGLAGRIWGLLTLILFVGIILTSHLDNGFFMNWFGQQKGEGFEFHLLVIGLASIVVSSGSGKASVDAFLLK